MNRMIRLLLVSLFAAAISFTVTLYISQLRQGGSSHIPDKVEQQIEIATQTKTLQKTQETLSELEREINKIEAKLNADMETIVPGKPITGTLDNLHILWEPFDVMDRIEKREEYERKLAEAQQALTNVALVGYGIQPTASASFMIKLPEGGAEFLTVKEGNLLQGWKIKSITQEKIVFEKDGLTKEINVREALDPIRNAVKKQYEQYRNFLAEGNSRENETLPPEDATPEGLSGLLRQNSNIRIYDDMPPMPNQPKNLNIPMPRGEQQWD